MSDSMTMFYSIFLGMILLNLSVAVLQYRDARNQNPEGSSVQLTSLQLWCMTLAVGLVAGIFSTELSLLTVVGFTFSFFKTALIARFSSLTLGTPYPRKSFLPILGLTWAAILSLYFLGLPFQVYCLPLALANAGNLIYVVYFAARDGGWWRLSLVEKCFIGTCAIFAVHYLDFPFFRPDPALTKFGGFLMIALIQIFGIVIPAMSNEVNRRRYLVQLENEVSEKTQMLFSSGKMAALGEMAAGMAHEINNPLMAIALSVHNLKVHLAHDKCERSYIEKKLLLIDQTVNRIAKIITGLRTFSRDAEKDPFHPAQLKGIIDDTLTLCAESLRHQGVAIQALFPERPIFVNCRPVQLSQVLLNLITNAVDAVNNLDNKWIRLEAREVGKTVEISVSDSGRGIPESIRQKLFQPFFTTKPVGHGTGLGLSITAGIVKAHGGTIELETRAENTTFVIRLPLVAQESRVAS